MNRYLYTNIHSNIIHNSQKLEATQVSISGWKDKQNVIYTCKRLIFRGDKIVAEQMEVKPICSWTQDRFSADLSTSDLINRILADMNFYCDSITVVPIFLLCPPLSPTPIPTVNPHTVVYVHRSFIHILWLVPSPSFHNDPLPSSPLAAVSLFHVSTSLVLFFLLVYFVH